MDVTAVMVDTPAIVDARRAGATYPDLQAWFGVTAGQLKTILRPFNLHGSPMIRARVPDEVQARMCALRDAGMSRREVSRETGWSEGSVDRAVARRDRGRE